MGFMEPQITGLQDWVRVDTSQGTEYIPVAETGLYVRNSETEIQPLTDEERESYKRRIWNHTNAEPQEWTTYKGYGARMSAPGYLDCTEWSVFETAEEAAQYLADEYGDDDTEEEEEEEETKYSVEESVDGEYLILVDGIQWGDNRDASGAGDTTFPTRNAALAKMKELAEEDSE